MRVASHAVIFRGLPWVKTNAQEATIRENYLNCPGLVRELQFFLSSQFKICLLFISSIESFTGAKHKRTTKGLATPKLSFVQIYLNVADQPTWQKTVSKMFIKVTHQNNAIKVTYYRDLKSGVTYYRDLIGDLTRRSWVQFPPWSEFFSVLVWAHFHQWG